MNKIIISVLLACMLLAGGLAPYTSVGAQTQSQPVSPPTNFASKGQNQYLIPLDFPSPEQINVPAGLDRIRAERYVQSITRRTAAPLLQKLRSLQQEGLVTHFELQTDLHAILVETTQAGQVHKRLGQVNLQPSSLGSPPTCLANAANALVDQVLGLSDLAVENEEKSSMEVDRVGATNPSIGVYLSPGGGWSRVSGQTSADTLVNLSILRAGKVIVSESVYSYGDGYYYFYADYMDCPIEGYEWIIQPGDTVEVTAAGNTITTVAVDISLWADPATNTVAGRTTPGRNVSIWLDYPLSGDPCSWNGNLVNTTSDALGNFSAVFPDFDSRAYGSAIIYDANGNSTGTGVDAFYIATGFGWSWVYGTIKPLTDFNATLQRVGAVIDSASGKSGPDGYYDFGFSQQIIDGDLISVTAPGISMSYTATTLTALLDPATDQIIGKTGSNRLVVGDFYHSWNFMTSCNGYYDCTGVVADGAGNYAITPGFDIQRGDSAYLTVFDSNGNRQYSDRYNAAVLSIEAPGWISGLWLRGNVGNLTVQLKDSSNVIKWQSSSVDVDYNGSFEISSGATIVAGDIIVVTDNSTYSMSMTASGLTGRLDSAADQLSGTAGNGKVVSEIYPFSNYACVEQGVSSNTYNFDLTSTGVIGWDSAVINNIALDGHITSLYRSAFSVGVSKDSNTVFGYTETPGAAVNIELWRSGVMIDSASTNSISIGYYYLYLTSTISEGDQLIITTGDGNGVSIDIPKLTIAIDGAQNVIYGQGPPNDWVYAYAGRVTGRYNASYIGQGVPTDGTGNYSADFTGYWYGNYYSGCQALTLSHPCAFAETDYYRSDGHLVLVETPWPAPAAADSFESDDSFTTASLFTTFQSHTFHQTGDVDWVKFTVTAADVATNRVISIYTYNLGLGEDTIIALYDTDGTTLLDWDDDSGVGYASLITWQFSTPGTYYVLVEPYDYEYNTGYCDARYDFGIGGMIFLPLVNK